jgi:hypothetical protein
MLDSHTVCASFTKQLYSQLNKKICNCRIFLLNNIIFITILQKKYYLETIEASGIFSEF